MVGTTPDNSHRESIDDLKNLHISLLMDFSGGTSGKESACQCRRHKRCRFNPWVGKIPWRRAWQPTLVSLPRESHGQRSLVAYSSWGCKESDTTEQHTHTHTQHSTQLINIVSVISTNLGKLKILVELNDIWIFNIKTNLKKPLFLTGVHII